MLVKRYLSDTFTSNTYLISDDFTKSALLVDVGEYSKVKHDLTGYKLEALLLTHPHYDHIYYINDLFKDYPEIKIYGHPITLDALADPKANLSFYHDDPVSFQEGDLYTLDSDQSGTLTIRDHFIHWFSTPGHHPGSISYQIGDYLFTGDSFIPGIPVVSKLKGGDKNDAQENAAFLKAKILDQNLITAPGHGEIMSTKQMLDSEDLGENPTIPNKRKDLAK